MGGLNGLILPLEGEASWPPGEHSFGSRYLFPGVESGWLTNHAAQLHRHMVVRALRNVGFDALAIEHPVDDPLHHAERSFTRGCPRLPNTRSTTRNPRRPT